MNADMIHFAKMAVRMYAETHPRPSHVTQTQGAAMLSRGRHLHLFELPHFFKNNPGRPHVQHRIAELRAASREDGKKRMRRALPSG